MREYRVLGITLTFMDGKKYHYWIYQAIAIVGLLMGMILLAALFFQPVTGGAIAELALVAIVVWLGLVILIGTRKAQIAEGK